MRGWHSVCVVLVTVAVLVHSRTLPAQILQYTEARHSRSEAGIPGNNVTGGWSWVDHHGQQHHIWYVADTRGFRAFGDVVPQPQATSLPMNVGVPVVVAIPFVNMQGKTTTSPASPSPLEVTGKIEITEESQQKSDQGKGIKRESAAVEVETQEPILPAATSSTTDTNSKQDFDAMELVTEKPEKKVTGDEERGDMIITTTTPVSTPTSTTQVTSEIPVPASTQSTRSEPSEEPLVVQPLLEDKIHGSPKSLAAPESSPSDGKPIDNLPDAKFHSTKQIPVTPSDNNFVASVFNKLSTVLGASDDNMQKPLLHQEPQNGLKNGDTPDAQQHSTSNFVLINRLQAPTIPKSRVGSQQLVPKPVNVIGQTDTVVTGLHSSGKPSTTRPIMHTATSYEPIGIHFLNLVPRPQKTINDNRPIPKPVRVVGEPSLDYFLLPASRARTTATPFRQPRPSRDYDYQYYDYYDYNDYRGDNTGGPVNPSRKTKTKSVRSNSEEYSLETDYSDSEESEDSSDSQ